MATKPSKQEEARNKSRTREPSRQVHAVLEAQFGAELVELVDAVDPFTLVKDPARFLEVMGFLKDDERLRFDHLRSVTGVDWPKEEQLESVYHLFSYPLGQGHVVKVRTPRNKPELPSVEALWPVANWFERESFDLLGIVYTGHTDLRRIMLPDDWVGHPLRKDYEEGREYRGISTVRPSPLDAFGALDEARRKAREARGEPPPKPIQSPIKAPEAEPKKDAAPEAGAPT